MQGYINYKIIGTEEEVNKALDKFKNIKVDPKGTFTQETVDYLLALERKIVEVEDNYMLEIGFSSHLNVNTVPYCFDRMVEALANEFKDYYIKMENYYTDEPCLKRYISEKGSDIITKIEFLFNETVEVELEEIEDDNMVIIECPNCFEYFESILTEHQVNTIENSLDIALFENFTECPVCGQPLNLEIVFPE